MEPQAQVDILSADPSFAAGRLQPSGTGNSLQGLTAEILKKGFFVIRGMGAYSRQLVDRLLTVGLEPAPESCRHPYLCSKDACEDICFSMTSCGYGAASASQYGANMRYPNRISLVLSPLYVSKHAESFCRVFPVGEQAQLRNFERMLEIGQGSEGLMLLKRFKTEEVVRTAPYDELVAKRIVPAVDESGVQSIGGFIVGSYHIGACIFQAMREHGVDFPVFDCDGNLFDFHTLDLEKLSMLEVDCFKMKRSLCVGKRNFSDWEKIELLKDCGIDDGDEVLFIHPPEGLLTAASQLLGIKTACSGYAFTENGLQLELPKRSREFPFVYWGGDPGESFDCVLDAKEDKLGRDATLCFDTTRCPLGREFHPESLNKSFRLLHIQSAKGESYANAVLLR